MFRFATCCSWRLRLGNDVMPVLPRLRSERWRHAEEQRVLRIESFHSRLAGETGKCELYLHVRKHLIEPARVRYISSECSAFCRRRSSTGRFLQLKRKCERLWNILNCECVIMKISVRLVLSFTEHTLTFQTRSDARELRAAGAHHITRVRPHHDGARLERTWTLRSRQRHQQRPMRGSHCPGNGDDVTTAFLMFLFNASASCRQQEWTTTGTTTRGRSSRPTPNTRRSRDSHWLAPRSWFKTEKSTPSCCSCTWTRAVTRCNSCKRTSTSARHSTSTTRTSSVALHGTVHRHQHSTITSNHIHACKYKLETFRRKPGAQWLESSRAFRQLHHQVKRRLCSWTTRVHSTRLQVLNKYLPCTSRITSTVILVLLIFMCLLFSVRCCTSTTTFLEEISSSLTAPSKLRWVSANTNASMLFTSCACLNRPQCDLAAVVWSDSTQPTTTACKPCSAVAGVPSQCGTRSIPTTPNRRASPLSRCSNRCLAVTSARTNCKQIL